MKSLTRLTSKAVNDKYRHGLVGPNYIVGRSQISFYKWLVVDVGFPNLTAPRCKTISPISATSHSQGSGTPVGEKDQSITVRVKFQLQKACGFGDHFLIVGDDPMFGSWDPENAIPLEWSDGHIWTAEVDVPIGKTIQFKFILKQSMGNNIWQPGLDRIFKTWSTYNTIKVVEDWENSELQKIIEEEATGSDDELQTYAESVEEIQPIAVAWDTHTTESLTKNSPTDMLGRIVAKDTDGTPDSPLVDVVENITFSEDVAFKPEKIIALTAEGANNFGTEWAISMMVAHNIVNDHGKCKSAEGLEDGAVFLAQPIDPVLVPGLAPISILSTDETHLAKKDTNNAANVSLRSQDCAERAALESKEELRTHEKLKHQPQEKQKPNVLSREENLKGESTSQELDSAFEQEILKADLEAEQKHDATTSNREETTMMKFDDEIALDSPYLDEAESQEVSAISSSYRVLKNEVHWGRKTLQNLLASFGLI